MDRRDKNLGKWYPNWEGPFKINQEFKKKAYQVELIIDSQILRVNGKYLKTYKPMLREVRIST